MEIDAAIQACEWSASQFLVFSGNVFDPLIYYSHLVPLGVSAIFALFVFIKNPKSLATRALFATVLFLSIWLFGDLVLWATESSALTMFFWSVINLVEPFVYAFSFYFIYVYISKKDLSLVAKSILFIPLLPIVVLTPTSFAIVGFDLSNCDRDAIEGPLVYYGYVAELIYILSIAVFAVCSWFSQKNSAIRSQIVLVTSGTVLFLLSFAFGNIIGSWFSDLTILGDYSWTIGQYGLFGVPVFIAFLSYLVVRYRAFNVGLIAAQALIAALLAILAAEYAFVHTLTNVVLVSVTLVLTGIIGIILIRSVRREIEQREHIEKLARDLQLANDNQVTLIHFITHQIKGFVTKSRNIFSMILEGDFGPIPEQMKPMIQEGFNSDTKGAATIQEILNASNIKSGKVTYKMEPFDLKGLIDGLARDFTAAAAAKGIALTLNTEAVTYTGDLAQLTNAFKNLIDNSIKYTPKGTVGIELKRVGDIVKFSIHDTGVGITPEDMENLFTEGGHGKESTKVNVESTGFGLYIVKNIIEAHKGKVWAESDGAGKGSSFFVELPV